MSKKQRIEVVEAGGTSAKVRAIEARIRKQFPNARVWGVASECVGNSTPMPTGSVMLDWAIGKGGLLPAKITEIYGPPSSGKSLVTYQIMRQYQLAGKVVLYFDEERSVDEKITLAWMAKQGVDVTNLLYCRDTAETAMDIACAAAEDPEMGLIVFDSIAALQLEKAIYVDDMGQQRYRSIANLFPIFCPKFLVLSQGAHLIGINHIRAAVGYTGKATVYNTPGGWGWKHYCQLRFQTKATRLQEKQGKDLVDVGLEIEVKNVKNKIASPGKAGIIRYYWDTGLDRVDEMVNLGLKTDCLIRSGSWTAYRVGDDEIKAQGIDNFTVQLRQQPDIQEALYKDILSRRDNVIDINPDELDVDEEVPA